MYIDNRDDYDHGTHGEDGILTRDEMIEREQFGGEPDPDEEAEKSVNSLIGSLCIGIVLAFATAAFFAAPWLMEGK